MPHEQKRHGRSERPEVRVDDSRHVQGADALGSKPECLAFQGPGHEGTDRPWAARILVRLDHEGLDPLRDRLQRIAIAFRELARPSNILEIFEEEEIGGLCWHGVVSAVS